MNNSFILGKLLLGNCWILMELDLSKNDKDFFERERFFFKI